jgi:hypothetical protein
MSPKRRYLPNQIHSVTSHTTAITTFTAASVSNIILALMKTLGFGKQMFC